VSCIGNISFGLFFFGNFLQKFPHDPPLSEYLLLESSATPRMERLSRIVLALPKAEAEA
jgi:hypothetical protein